MNIVDFVNEQTHKLNAFLDYWTRMHLLDPENYPLDLDENNSGMWFEQYEIFIAWDHNKKL